MSSSFSLEFEEGCNISKNCQKEIENFIGFIFKKLALDGYCDIRIISDREKNGVKTTAFYNHNNGLCCVYGANRLGIDICRSVCHELIHMKQYEQNRVPENPLDVGGKVEDEANAVAGQLVKIYTKKRHPKSLF
mgnify:CR=1 FL=1|jgi:hypothetical protein